MTRDVKTEQQLKNFYNQSGWSHNESGDSLDAALWEDLRPAAREYVEKCRLRVLRFLPRAGERILDAASGPVQYPEYLKYSEGFQKRVCVDISESALEQAKKKLGTHGEYICASLQELPFPANHFDASMSIHTIYHIDRNQQAMAVRELIRVTKPGAPLVILYANPDKLLSRIKRLFGGGHHEPTSGPIYYFAYPLSWWRQFSDQADVKLYPWRSLTAQDSRRLIPDNALGKFLFKCVFRLEELFPAMATFFGAYPLILIRKK